MHHNHVSVLRIFKILNRCHFWRSLGTPRVFVEFGKWIGSGRPYHGALFLFIIKLLEMRNSHTFVLKIFKIVNGFSFWPSLGSFRVFLAGRKLFRGRVRRLEIVTHIM